MSRGWWGRANVCVCVGGEWGGRARVGGEGESGGWWGRVRVGGGGGGREW